MYGVLDGRGHLWGHSQCLPRLTEERASEGGGMCRGWGSCLLRLPSFPVLPLYIFKLPRGIHLGKCHLHFFFSHVQVKVLLPVLADVRA